MSLSYLTGDDIGKSKKSGGGGGGRSKGKSKGAKAARSKQPKQKKSKEQKKANRKRVTKKVAKVALAPARTAFLQVCKLNLLKISTKIARVWKSGGKEDITKFWTGFGGNMEAFKKAVSQGAKDKISGDAMGVVTATAVIATATPIIAALVPIVKKFKAAGSEDEAAEFNEGYDKGRKALADNDDVPKSEVSMPKNKDSGIVVDKNGDSQEDKKQAAKNEPESKSGGSDDDDEKKKMSKGSSGGGGSSEDSSDDDSKAKTKYGKKAETAMSSFASPLGFFFKIIMFSMLFQWDNIFMQIVNSYCFIGMLLVPVAITKNPFQKFAYALTYAPLEKSISFINSIKITWQRNQLRKQV